MNFTSSFPIDISRRIFAVLSLCIGLILVGLLWLGSRYIPVLGSDWVNCFRPAAQALLALKSPYSVQSFFNPPWALLPLLPLAALPLNIGAAAFFLASITAWIFVCARLEANLISILAFLLSYPIVSSLVNGQIDTLVALGIVSPPALGVFLVLIKPQVGLGIFLYWLVDAFHTRGTVGVIRLITPVLLAFSLSVLLFGPWPLTREPLNASHSISFFPWSIPVGLALLGWSIYRRAPLISVSASLLLSPYAQMHSWVLAFLPVLRHPKWVVILSVASWLYALRHLWI